MAGQSWCIKIVPSGNTVAFDPDVYGVEPGSPLQASVGDLIAWNNETDDARTISISGETLEVDAWKSTSAYEIQNPNNTPVPYTIDYTCTVPNEDDSNGAIDVVA